MEKFQQWKQLAEKLQKIKAEEMQLRKEICAEILMGLPLPSKKTLVIDVFKVEAKNDLNYKLDDTILSPMFKELTDPEKNSLKFEPKLRLREYKNLDDDDNELLIHEAITVKPSAPYLKVKGKVE